MPPKNTAQDNIWPLVENTSSKFNINKIKERFNKIGEAAPIANLLKEFKMPLNNETREINNK